MPMLKPFMTCLTVVSLALGASMAQAHPMKPVHAVGQQSMNKIHSVPSKSAQLLVDTQIEHKGATSPKGKRFDQANRLYDEQTQIAASEKALSKISAADGKSKDSFTLKSKSHTQKAPEVASR